MIVITYSSADYGYFSALGEDAKWLLRRIDNPVVLWPVQVRVLPHVPVVDYSLYVIISNLDYYIRQCWLRLLRD